MYASWAQAASVYACIYIHRVGTGGIDPEEVIESKEGVYTWQTT